MGSGRGSVGRAVTYDTLGSNMKYLVFTVTKTKLKGKEAENSQFE